MKLFSLLTGQGVWSDAEQMAHDKHSERARFCVPVSEPRCMEQWGCEEHHQGTFHFLAGRITEFLGGKFNRATPVTWWPVRWDSENRYLWLQRHYCGSLGELQRLRVCILMPKQPFTSDWKCYCSTTNTYTGRGACSTCRSCWNLCLLFVACAVK